MTYGKPAADLARLWILTGKDEFPAEDLDLLTRMLAEEIQSTLEDFTNPDYREITMKSLEKRKANPR